MTRFSGRVYDEGMRGVRVAVAGILCGLCACNEPVYLQQNRPLDATTPEMVMEGEDQLALFADSDLFVLPVRKPTAKEQQKLEAERQKLGLPMPVPWCGERDFDIEVEWSIKNLDSQMIGSRVTLNGGNEFGDYVKTLYGNPDDEDAPQPPELLGSDQLVPMEAGTVRSGVFREDELREAGLDLEVITRYPPPNVGMNAPFIAIEHDSSASSVGLEGIPKGDVTPAMVRFLFTLEATGHASLDYVIRVREKGTPGDKLDVGGKDLYVSTASVVMPPVLPTADPTDD